MLPENLFAIAVARKVVTPAHSAPTLAKKASNRKYFDQNFVAKSVNVAAKNA
jgi:hypothetical protein